MGDRYLEPYADLRGMESLPFGALFDSCHFPHAAGFLARRILWRAFTFQQRRARQQRFLFPCRASSRRKIFHGPDVPVPAYSPGLALDSSSLLQRQSLRLRPARRVESHPLWRIRPRRIGWFRCTSPHYAELPGRFGTGTARYLSADASGTFLSVNSMLTWCCLENSPQKALIAATTPR